MRIAVVGGTGVVGRHVVEAVRAGGDTPIVIARSAGVDVRAGTGLDKALEGVAVVVDAGNVNAVSARASIAYFETSTQNLLAAEQRAGVQHHVVLSIVRCDRVDLGYYLGKRRQEEVALAGPVPATVLRTTQFHEFAGQVLARMRVPGVAIVPKMLSQPVAARDVGAALADLARTPPGGLAQELAGPEPMTVADMARGLLRAQHKRAPVLAVRMPGAAGGAMARGDLLPGAEARRTTYTYAQWLADGAR